MSDQQKYTSFNELLKTHKVYENFKVDVVFLVEYWLKENYDLIESLKKTRTAKSDYEKGFMDGISSNLKLLLEEVLE